MRVFVTGGSGFLGRHIVAEALRRGHVVRAVIRPATQEDVPELRAPGVELVRLDLRSRIGLEDALRGTDTVIHAAASKAGDMYTQYGGTVVATENLLEAMASLGEAGPRRIVGISSFAVYDYIRMRGWSVLDEKSPLAPQFPPRDEYSHTKLVQEQLIREAAGRNRWEWMIVRPGVIYGPDNLWTARLGIAGGPHRWLRVGSLAQLPITYVENCAHAILLAAEKAGPAGLVVNVLDDDRPSQRAYAREVRRRLHPGARMITVPWPLWRGVARAASLVNTLVFRGRAKLPSILIPARVHARFKPLRYNNRVLHEQLGWEQRVCFRDALERSVPASGGQPAPAHAGASGHAVLQGAS